MVFGPSILSRPMDYQETTHSLKIREHLVTNQSQPITNDLMLQDGQTLSLETVNNRRKFLLFLLQNYQVYKFRRTIQAFEEIEFERTGQLLPAIDHISARHLDDPD